MRNNSIIAFRARAQLEKFIVKMFHGFSKPTMKFLGDMMYGIMASGTTVLSEIVRSFAPDGKQRSVENRLSFNLAAGLKRAFTRYGRWAPKIEETKNFAPMLPGWDEMMYTGAG